MTSADGDAEPAPAGRHVVPLDVNVWRPVLGELQRAVVAVIVMLNLLNAFAIASDPQEGGRRWLLLDGESNPTTWASTLILAGAAALGMVCRVVDRPGRATFWSLIAAALLVMSLDEVATIHERVGGGIGSALDDDGLAYLWVVPVTIGAAVVIVLLWRSRPHLERGTTRALLLGAGTFAFGALGMEALIVLTPWTYADWDTEALIMTSVEENLEMIGALVMAGALAGHAAAVLEPADQDTAID